MLSGPFLGFNTCEFARKGTESSNSADKLLITDDLMAEGRFSRESVSRPNSLLTGNLQGRSQFQGDFTLLDSLGLRLYATCNARLVPRFMHKMQQGIITPITENCFSLIAESRLADPFTPSLSTSLVAWLLHHDRAFDSGRVLSI
jgi:hypothetical protein